MSETFLDLKSRHRQRAAELMPEALARVDWDREKLEAYQLSLLRSLLAHVKECSGWYADTRLAAVDPRRMTRADLASIQPTTKADLVDNFDAIVADKRLSCAICEEHLEREATGGAYLLDEYRVSVSGGTSGSRAISVFGWDEFAHNWNGFMRMTARWAARTRAVVGPPKVATVTASSDVHGSQQLAGIFGAPDTVRTAVTDPICDITDALNKCGPDVILAYPSVLPALAREADAQRLRIAPKMILCGGEPLLPEHEEAAARAWGCGTASIWGASEVGMLGAGTGFESGMLIFDDMCIVEPVDERGDAVSPGERAAKIFVTPLRRRGLPVLRYELTDQLVVRPEGTSCGSCFTRTSNVEGRLDDAFTYGDIVVNAHLFRSVLSLEKRILEYQVFQRVDGGHVVVVVDGELDDRRLADTLASRLRRLGIHDARVTVKRVDRIERDTHSMKLRRFIALPTMRSNRLDRGE